MKFPHCCNAGFHLDFYIHFRSKGYNALFQTDSCDYVDRGEEVTCFFNREGGGNIRAFTDEFMENLAYISGRGYMCMPTGNHDMIRYSHRRTQDEMKLVAAFIMLMPSIPFVYYGDEIGLPYREGLASKEGGYFRTGSRTPMQWDGGKNRGFSSADGALYLPVDMSPASPDVQAQAADENSLLNTVKRFARLRAGEEALQAADNLELVYAAEGEYPFVFRRGKFVVAVNPCARQAQAALPQGNFRVRESIGKATLESGSVMLGALVVLEENA